MKFLPTSIFAAILPIALFSQSFAQDQKSHSATDANPSSDTSKTITLCADPWPPFNSKPNSGREGILIDIAKIAFEKEGYSVNYKIMPWSRAILEAQKGNIEGIIGASPKEVENFVFPKIPNSYSKDAFFVPDDSPWEFKGVESLENVRLGGIHNYDYSEIISHYIQKNINDSSRIDFLLSENALELNIRKLLKGRIDVLIESPLVFYAACKKHDIPVNQFRLIDFADKASGVYIAFSPNKENSKKLADLLDKTMQQLLDSGEIKKIYQDYGIDYDSVIGAKIKSLEPTEKKP